MFLRRFQITGIAFEPVLFLTYLANPTDENFDSSLLRKTFSICEIHPDFEATVATPMTALSFDQFYELTNGLAAARGHHTYKPS